MPTFRDVTPADEQALLVAIADVLAVSSDPVRRDLRRALRGTLTETLAAAVESEAITVEASQRALERFGLASFRFRALR